VIPLPRRAIVLAAGRGERMRPLSDGLPKPLIPVGGRALLDRALDALDLAGVEHAVVNAWYRADMVERHLAARVRPAITLSREEALLGTAGGIIRAIPLLGRDPFFVVNGDQLWRDRGASALHRLAQHWDDAGMDGLLLLHPLGRAVGFDGAGDFRLDAAGRISWRGAAPAAPFAFAGVQLVHPRLFDGFGPGRVEFGPVWSGAMERGRLHGLVHTGEWCHVGTPDSIALAEAWLAAGA
jgi:MurNAc alpha-1-phosphate uridylyltransferase